MKYLKVWTSFREVVQTLNLDEIGSLFLMMLEYAETGKEPAEYIGNEAFLFPVAKQQIDLAAERAEILRQNGSKGGQAKSRNRQTVANDSNDQQNVANDSNGKQNVAVKKRKEKESNEKKGNEKKSPSESFIPPTVEEVAAYCRERGNTVNADRFVNFYAAKGWKVGNQPMKDWKAAVRSWEGRDGKPVKTVTAQQYEQRDYTGVQERMESALAKRIAERGAS